MQSARLGPERPCFSPLEVQNVPGPAPKWVGTRFAKSYAMNTAAPRTTAYRPTPDQIAAAACHLYLENGRGDGDLLQDWIRAEELLLEGFTIPCLACGDNGPWPPLVSEARFVPDRG